EALEVDEDYFPDEGTYVPEPSAPKSFKVDRQKLLEEAVAGDMRLEVVYFFVELGELGEKVFEMYKQAKRQERTMLEATVVTKLAIVTANSLTATLQLRYRSLQQCCAQCNIILLGLPFLGELIMVLFFLLLQL
ncbi:hypothetical protein JG688_00016636, partial [Phytophthora aleatoria]